MTELGGPAMWADAVGSVPVAAFTVSKVRWMARSEPDNAERTSTVMLPHDYLTWMLADQPQEATTDRGDASGTGYWSPIEGEYRRDLMQLALGKDVQLPRVAGRMRLGRGRESPGHSSESMDRHRSPSVPGDDRTPRSLWKSLPETSWCPWNVRHCVRGIESTDGPTGLVAGFADASGVFLPLVCTLNAARITGTAELLGVDMDSFAALALAAEPGAGGLSCSRTSMGNDPNLPDARGSLHIGRRIDTAGLARAAVEVLGGLADAVDALVDVGVQPSRVLVVGGAASNPAVTDVAATLVDVPVQIPPAGEYVADGAARQAAWILHGGEQPAWSDVRPGETVSRDPQPVAQVREQYRQAREALYA